MKLHGSTEGNLIAALGSARRFRGQPVHADTFKHWSDVLQHAGHELTSGLATRGGPIEQLVTELKIELASRPIVSGAPPKQERGWSR